MRTVTLVHPFPSILTALLVGLLALVAGADHGLALALAGAMLGFQVSIGALNDLLDADRDRSHKPGNPVADGLVSVPVARAVTVAGATLGLVLSARLGLPTLLLGVAGYWCGVIYDVSPTARRWGWLCFAAAMPLLLSWTWVAVTGGLPPGWQVLLPMAALAGPALHLANGLVDRSADASAGSRRLAVRLGPRQGAVVLAVLLVIIEVAAWPVLLRPPLRPLPLMAGLGSAALALTGVLLSVHASEHIRESGWRAVALAVALLAASWLDAISP